jgi:hypothetical protein
MITQIGNHFADLARVLRRDLNDEVDPDRVVQVAVAAIPNADHCAITLVQDTRRPRTLAATGALTRNVDDLQYATGEGPCLDAIDKDDLVEVEDLAVDDRWPAFGRKCVEETGIHSVLSVRLVLGPQDRAALNLYAATPSAFTDIDTATGSIFAPFAAAAVEASLRREDVENLKAALTSSRQIGIAVGILMAREHVTSEQAFDLLKEASNHLNRRLRDIAAEVEYTGELPQCGASTTPDGDTA